MEHAKNVKNIQEHKEMEKPVDPIYAMIGKSLWKMVPAGIVKMIPEQVKMARNVSRTAAMTDNSY